MARIDKNKLISGTVGNVVFRNTGTQQILLSKPDAIKQTKETKASGSEFRQCSSWAKRMRIGLLSFLGKYTDAYMHGRFTGQLYAAVQTNSTFPKGERTPLNSNLSLLSGFEFNTHSPFADYFTPELTAVRNSQNQIVLNIPQFNPKTALKFAQNARHAELLLYVVAVDFETNTGFPDGFTLIPIENKEQTISETVWISPPMPQGRLILVCAKLLFYNTNRFTEKEYVNSKTCNPIQLIHVMQ